MFFPQRESMSNGEAIHWQHEVLRNYIIDIMGCTIEQADKLIAMREQLEANTEMIERVQEQRRLAFARYLVEHKHLHEDLLNY